MTPRVSVVIVSYRSREALEQCLPSLAACGTPLEAIVVDNASGDGTVEWVRAQHPWVRVIAGERNEGYGRGVNRGASEARGAAILVLNPDCVVPKGALERLLLALERHPDLAAVGPALLDERGEVARSCGRFPTLWSLVCDHLGLAGALPRSAWFGGYKYGERTLETLDVVDWVSGAAMLIPRRAWERVGPFDPNIFMYMEEVEWCRRAATLGMRARYAPQARFVHYGQRSSVQTPGRTYLHNLRARVYYFRKHHGARAAAAARAVLILSLVAKWLVARVRGGAERAGVYAQGLHAVWEPPQERAT